MIAAGLFLLLVAAKLLPLIGGGVPLSITTPLAYLWQDAMVVLVFALAERTLPWRRVTWPLYAAVAGYTVLNVVVVRTIGRPLSAAMWRAADAAFADSIAHHLTPANGGVALVALAVAVAAPWWTVRRRRLSRTLVAAAFVVAAVGPFAGRILDAPSLHRNALFALGRSLVPRVAATPGGESSSEGWRTPLTDTGVADDLRGWRGRARGRDVLLVVLESAGAGYLRPWGAPDDPMPRLTALAEDALVFESAYAVYPESIKGLVAILAARAPAIDTSPDDYAGRGGPWLPRLLPGHRSALFHSGRFGFLGMNAIVRERGFDRLADAGDVGGERASSFGADDLATADALLAWIGEGGPGAPGAPWLAAFLPVSGHHPYDAPEQGPFPNDTDFGAYRNALHHADRAVGRLLDGLAARGRLERTLVVVVGDHGQAFRQHRGNYGHAFHLYEENVRVPFLIAAPGEAGFGRRVRTVATHVDVVPTILDLLGEPVGPIRFEGRPVRFDGGSLLDPVVRTALFFTDYDQAWLGARDGRWKYLLDVESGRPELYDLAADPSERHDRARDEPGLAARFEARVRAWAAATRGRVLDGR